jgi:surfeit locus 1 family protein
MSSEAQNPAAKSRLRRGLLVPSVMTVGALAALIALGSWQLERKVWKENLIAAIEARLAGPAEALPPSAQWNALKQEDDEFRRVKFRAEIGPDKAAAQSDAEARVYTSGSALRDDVKAPGYFVFAPARLASGQTVVVNRGYVVNAHPDAATPPVARPDGVVEITGVLRWPEPSNWFVTDYSARENLWYVRDPASMARQAQWGAVAPFYIEQELPVPADGLPKPGKLKVSLPDNHLQYALTWYGLALVLLGIYGAWFWKRREEQMAAS